MGRRTKGGKSERRHEVEQKIQKASEGRKVGGKMEERVKCITQIHPQ